MDINPLSWDNGILKLLDQRYLPAEEVWLDLTSWQEVAEAIRDMAVRGAPAIGLAAAYGMALAAFAGQDLKMAKEGLASSRPTAVNLFWALDRIGGLKDQSPESILMEAKAMEYEDRRMGQSMGLYGASLLPSDCTILTICNTGSLAMAGDGTALSVIKTAHKQGQLKKVYACETRPRLQGLRLTAWELKQSKIPFAMIVDSAAASLMGSGKIDAVIAGADRIAATGDTVNKIGTSMLAICAKHFDIPFYIAAPRSTIDPHTASGGSIPIEERSESEVTFVGGALLAPKDCPVYNPAFDMTDHRLISAIITECGIQYPPYDFTPESIRTMTCEIRTV